MHLLTLAISQRQFIYDPSVTFVIKSFSLLVSNNIKLSNDVNDLLIPLYT